MVEDGRNRVHSRVNSVRSTVCARSVEVSTLYTSSAKRRKQSAKWTTNERQRQKLWLTMKRRDDNVSIFWLLLKDNPKEAKGKVMMDRQLNRSVK